MANTKKAVFVPAAANLAFSKKIVASLDGLVEERKVWEATAYKQSNTMLYALLAKCLDVFNSKFMNGSDDDRKTLRSDLVARLNAAGIKTQKSSPTLNLFVRFVFSSDRKRAHTYAYVLKAAVSHAITAAGFGDWLTAEGGIEEVRRKMVVNVEVVAKRNKVDVAKVQVKASIEQACITPLATVSLAGVTGDYAVLLAKPRPNGMVDIVGVLSAVEAPLYNNLLQKLAVRKVSANAEKVALSSEVDLLRNAANDPTEQLAKAA